MCGIGGVLRIILPGDPDVPREGPSRLAPREPWCWHGPSIDPAGVPRSEDDWLIPDSWLDLIDERIRPRGPDGAGRFRDRAVRADGAIVEVALVHRRLSIIDLACGAQPMTLGRCPQCREGSPDDPPRLAVAFNGCIYNHRALRAELESAGHHFESNHADTEVILHGWAQWGPALQDRLDGMYALALWDHHAAELVVMRDRFGEKPLFLQSFSRDLHALASVPGACDDLCQAVTGGPRVPTSRAGALRSTIITGRWTQGPAPAPNDPADLDAGSMRRLSNGPRATPPSTRRPIVAERANDRASRLDTLAQLVRDAVRSRLDADVPLACLLSGGVDSSLVAWALRESGAPALALTVRMPVDAIDESAHARRVALHLGLPHEVVACEPSAAEDLVRLVRAAGMPLGDSSILPTYWVCRAAAGRAKVLLGGDGADELFFGYDRFKALDVLHRWGWLLRRVPSGWLDARDPRSTSSRIRRLCDAARIGGWSSLEHVFSFADARRLFPRAGLDTAAPEIASLDAARRAVLDGYLRRDILHKTDVASLLAGVELRSPFLAPALADFALRIPADEHIRQGQTKHLLKQLARRHLPAQIVNRPKQGFAIPISDWFRTDFGSLRTLLLDRLAGEHPFGALHDLLELDMGFVRRMLDEHWAAGGLRPLHTTRAVRPRDHGQRLFSILTLALWSRSV